MSDIVIVLTTAPADDRAEQWAQQLVDERLAACVNIYTPMVSVYRWKGKVQRDAERQMIIKTTRDRLAALEARVQALHSYELPEFIIVAVGGGSDRYVSWVKDQVV